MSSFFKNTDLDLHKAEKIHEKYKPNKSETYNFYKNLKKFLSFLSKKYKKKVVICIHPKSTKKVNNYFKGFYKMALKKLAT